MADLRERLIYVAALELSTADKKELAEAFKYATMKGDTETAQLLDLLIETKDVT